MQMTGLVTQLDGEWAEIKVTPLAGCASCGRCTLGAKPRTSQIRAYNQAGAQKGAEVVVEVDSEGLVSASAWLYLLPSALILIGLALGYRTGGDGLALVGAAMGILLSLGILRVGDGWWRKKKESAIVVEICKM